MAEYELTSPKLWAPFEAWSHRAHVLTFIARMQAAGFSIRHTYHAVRAIGDFTTWLSDRHEQDIAIAERETRAFIAWRAERPSYRHGTRIALSRFLDVLREAGAVPPPVEAQDPQSNLLRAYGEHLAARGLSARSIRNYAWFAGSILPELWSEDSGVGHLTRSDVARYVERHALAGAQRRRGRCAARSDRSSDFCAPHR